MKLHPEWSKDDRHNATAFFGSITGQRIIETLIANRPEISGKDMVEVGLSGTKAQTWENCVNMIATITAAEPANMEPPSDGFEQVDPTQFSNRPVRQ